MDCRTFWRRRFRSLAAFKRDNPDWPTLAALGKRAEEALLAGKPPAAVRAFFAGRPPTSPEGKIVLALAAKSAGASSEAAALVRNAWRNDTFGGEFERKILDLFPRVLSQADHRDRMERFLTNERWSAAIRAAGYAGKDYVLVANARMAVAQKAPMPFGCSSWYPPDCAPTSRISSPKLSCCGGGTKPMQPRRSWSRMHPNQRPARRRRVVGRTPVDCPRAARPWQPLRSIRDGAR